ncbi:MAG: hypothetical protein IJG17_03945, partial [Eubacterium sp.]|nr:hypothetical protein [Eubacterium sp.]
FSPNAKVFVLIHKMDLVMEEKRDEIFEKRKQQLEEKSANFKMSTQSRAKCLFAEPEAAVKTQQTSR